MFTVAVAAQPCLLASQPACARRPAHAGSRPTYECSCRLRLRVAGACRSPPHLPAITNPCREDARFLYKRTPDATKAASPELQAAFALLQRVWCKDYQHMWPALQVRRDRAG